jgi:hypothetical protein
MGRPGVGRNRLAVDGLSAPGSNLNRRATTSTSAEVVALFRLPDAPEGTA